MRGKLRYLVALAAASAVNFSYGAVQPEAVMLGPVQFAPTLSISEGHNSNIFYQPTNEKSSAITTISPSLQFLLQHNDDAVGLSYSGNYGRYASSSADNYNDHIFDANAQFQGGRMNTFNLDAAYRLLHDPRGTGASQGNAALSRAHPDRYHQTEFSGSWNLGIQGAPMSFRLTADHMKMNYVSNLALTKYRDRTDNGFTFRIYGNASGKTRYFYEHGQTNFNYENPTSIGVFLNSKEKSNYVGVEWDITGKTTGSVKVGRVKKDFDAAGIIGDSLTGWQAQVTWKPRTYSSFTLTSARQPQETNGQGSAINHTTTSLSWDHDWTSYLHSNVMANFGHDTYVANPRSDKLRNFGVGVNYDMRRWLNVRFNYSHNKRESNQSQYNYNQNIYAVTFTVSM